MRVLFTALVVLTATACNKAVTETEAAALRVVTVEATTFTPSEVTIREGGTVRFSFQGTAHNIIFTEQPGRPENIETVLANTTEERVFPEPGTFSYTCGEHRNMTGTITVDPLSQGDDS
jgi:plastocyanin